MVLNTISLAIVEPEALPNKFYGVLPKIKGSEMSQWQQFVLRSSIGFIQERDH
jgi:hypothetical protein